jgi:nucleoside-diphosphate-sugar epimerase
MHTLITGGAGFIGSHIADRLLKEGKQVVVIDDLSTGSSGNLSQAMGHPKFTFIRSKISGCPDLRGLLERAEAVYHLAAGVGVDLVVKSPIRVLQNNLHETEVLLNACAGLKVPFLLTSSSEVYGKSQKPVFSEEDDLLIGPPHQSRWSYACSKLMDEFLVLAHAREEALPVVIARLFNTVGPRQTGSFGMVLPRFISAAKTGQPLRIHGDGSQSRCFSYVADTVESLVRLQHCPSARGQVFNVGGTEEVTIRTLAEIVVQVLQSKSTLEFVPYEAAYAPGFDDMRRRKPMIDKLFAAVGFRPTTPLVEIIQRTAAAV